MIGSVGGDGVGEHHGTGVVDEADGQVRGLDDHLAEVQHAAASEERARIERGVEGPRPPRVADSGPATNS